MLLRFGQTWVYDVVLCLVRDGYVLCAVGSVMYGASVRGQTVEGAALLWLK
jgi:hypothetical protein